MEEETTPKPKTTPRRKKLAVRGVMFLIVLCALLAASTVVFYKKYQTATGKAGPSQEALVAKLGTTIQLPNEKPTSVTVADKQKLSNQVLAARVEDKDILLIFSEAKRLIVYRPSTEKVVDMLTFSSQQELPASATPSTDQTQPATVPNQ